MLRRCAFAVVVIGLVSMNPAAAQEFRLVVGVDAGLYPGAIRSVMPSGSGFPGQFFDGDRLAGTADVGPEVVFGGLGIPLIAPNEFGSLSFMFKRGTIPTGPPGSPVIPFMGIDFLGGPLVDLDGDLDNGSRSLIPVTGQNPVLIPGSTSVLDLSVDVDAGVITLENVDMTGTNEAGPNVPAEVAVVVVTVAGTQPDGSQADPPNPDVDTRVGTLTPVVGNSGTLSTVYEITDLGYEVWQDTLLASSSTASTLGTLQYLGFMRGWLVQRDPDTGAFPVLSGEGLGSTIWAMVDVSEVGNTFNTANGLAGGLATIADGVPSDVYSVPGNGGLPLTDFGGDLGAYFDNLVVPQLDDAADSFVYLESAGFGINNSNDPVFTDTVAYDMVLIAQSCPPGNPDLDGTGMVDSADLALLLGSWGPCGAGCCPADLNGDGIVDASDLALLLGSWG